MGTSVFDDQASQRLEAVYLTPDVVEQRRQTLRALKLQPGEQVLDVGSGPGLLAAEMAAAVGPTGHVTGIDASHSMVTLSRRRCDEPEVAGRLSFIDGDATALPFEDAAFDVGVSTQVYEYVEDVAAALQELGRVIRPGGRALILDTDWDSVVWNASNPERMQKILAAWARRFAHPHLPRMLTRLLQDAGFYVEHRDVLVIFNPEYDSETYSLRNAEIMASFAVDHQSVPIAEIEAWKEDLESLGRKGGYFFSLNRYLFMATK